jgi:hypothetical protein
VDPRGCAGGATGRSTTLKDGVNEDRNTAVDRILGIIDVGLQSECSAVTVRTTERPVCWRCGATAKPGCVCDGCRAWMTGEIDDDPAKVHHRRVEFTNIASDYDAGEQASRLAQAGAVENVADFGAHPATPGNWYRYYGLFAPVDGLGGTAVE